MLIPTGSGVMMQTLRGRGKIYSSRLDFLDEIAYEIFVESGNGGNIEWRGEIIPDNGIMPIGNHIIELSDGRRGPGVTGINSYSSFELVIDSYSIRGTGPLVP